MTSPFLAQSEHAVEVSPDLWLDREELTLVPMPRPWGGGGSGKKILFTALLWSLPDLYAIIAALTIPLSTCTDEGRQVKLAQLLLFTGIEDLVVMAILFVLWWQRLASSSRCRKIGETLMFFQVVWQLAVITTTTIILVQYHSDCVRTSNVQAVSTIVVNLWRAVYQVGFCMMWCSYQ